MDNLIVNRSKVFAIRVIRLYQYLSKEKREFVLSRQLLRSGTSIGANITEARYAQSRADFISKHSIALKEAAETEYWLDLLMHTEYIADSAYKSMHKDCTEIIKLLTAIINSSKAGVGKN